MHSRRFDRSVVLTHHAQNTMQERHISEAEIMEIIETGIIRNKDERRVWIYRQFPSRKDNLLCVAAMLENIIIIIIKTIMTFWEVSP